MMTMRGNYDDGGGAGGGWCGALGGMSVMRPGTAGSSRPCRHVYEWERRSTAPRASPLRPGPPAPAPAPEPEPSSGCFSAPSLPPNRGSGAGPGSGSGELQRPLVRPSQWLSRSRPPSAGSCALRPPKSSGRLRAMFTAPSRCQLVSPIQWLTTNHSCVRHNSNEASTVDPASFSPGSRLRRPDTS